MGLWQRLTGRKAENPALALYQAVVAHGRAPHWYEAGGVPDTINGRFDMIATVLAIVLLRMEAEQEAAAASAQLAECFIDDMDGQLRQSGVGDVVVGKRMGKMMGLVGGRLGAYRDGLASEGFEDALLRNLYRGEHPGEAALAHSAGELRALHTALAGVPLDALLAGRLPG
ncbi:ubiquinol-cytochrome C chaperone family protein [Sphingomonas sp. LT1P40]